MTSVTEWLALMLYKRKSWVQISAPKIGYSDFFPPLIFLSFYSNKQLDRSGNDSDLHLGQT